MEKIKMKHVNKRKTTKEEKRKKTVLLLSCVSVIFLYTVRSNKNYLNWQGHRKSLAVHR